MISYNHKNPEVITLPNPIDLDAAIVEVQNELSALLWLEKIFGRAKTLPTSDIEGNQKLQPMVYQGGGEYYSVLANDALRAYSFFRVMGARKIDSLEAGTKPAFAKTMVDLVFWVNLQEIDRSKDYDFSEELINEAVNVLGQSSRVKILACIDEKAEDIFRGYTLNTKQRELLYYPFKAFRFELEMYYNIDCK